MHTALTITGALACLWPLANLAGALVEAHTDPGDRTRPSAKRRRTIACERITAHRRAQNAHSRVPLRSSARPAGTPRSTVASRPMVRRHQGFDQ